MTIKELGKYIKVNLYYIIALGNFKNSHDFLKQLE